METCNAIYCTGHRRNGEKLQISLSACMKRDELSGEDDALCQDQSYLVWLPFDVLVFATKLFTMDQNFTVNMLTLSWEWYLNRFRPFS